MLNTDLAIVLAEATDTPSPSFSACTVVIDA
jgi:hypothetical protein